MAESHLVGGRRGYVTEVMGNDVFAITPTAEHVMGVAGLGPPSQQSMPSPTSLQNSRAHCVQVRMEVAAPAGWLSAWHSL